MKNTALGFRGRFLVLPLTTLAAWPQGVTFISKKSELQNWRSTQVSSNSTMEWFSKTYGETWEATPFILFHQAL